MNQRSSSTSNSNGEPVNWRRTLKFGLLIVLFLALFDIGINVLFSYPSDPKNLKVNRLQLYFDYGRSMEGRIRRATRPDKEATAPITLTGWYDPLVVVTRPEKSLDKVVSFYGNSQSVRLADAMQSIPDSYSVRIIAGPGSTANWAYGAFLRDPREEQGEAAVLTIMPSNLPMIGTMSAMTWNTSFAMPYTADIFTLEGGELVRRKPPYESFEDYVKVLGDQELWNQAKKVFQRHDPFYDAFIFEATVLDNSTIVRLLRRGWSQRRDARARARSLNRSGFAPNNREIKTANAMIVQFAQESRARKILPVVHVVNSRGYGDQMYRALASTFEKHRITYISSHKVVDPNDPRNYLSDGHFTDANDLRIAKELDRILKARLTD